MVEKEVQNMKLVQDNFDELMGMVYNATIPPEQYEELRRMFFAGAMWVTSSYIKEMETNGATLELIHVIQKECESFGENLKRTYGIE
jgi:hypothetical protein